MEDRKSLIRWIKDHKKQMIIAGISIGTLILIILGIKNRAAIKAVWDSLKGVVKHPTAKAAEEVAKVVTDIPQHPLRRLSLPWYLTRRRSLLKLADTSVTYQMDGMPLRRRSLKL